MVAGWHALRGQKILKKILKEGEIRKIEIFRIFHLPIKNVFRTSKSVSSQKTGLVRPKQQFYNVVFMFYGL